MALRHLFPDAVIGEMVVDEEPGRAPPVMRKPREVKFRVGGDVAEVCRQMVCFKNVRLDAAPGAGKSTIVPYQLACASNARVVHVVPSRLLAVDLFDYLSKGVNGKNYVLALSPSDAWGDAKVVISYSANIVAMLIMKLGGGKPLGEDTVLYLDECHESDAYTYTLAKIGPTVVGVKAVVYASATHEADRAPMREPEGQMSSSAFSVEHKVSSWDPLDAGKPWSITSFTGNALLFVDSDMEAQKLVTSYQMAGVTAYRLTSTMQVSMFRIAMAAMRDDTGGIVVLIADYSFRSGFTMDVDCIIDSSIVKYYYVEGSSVKVGYRRAYSLERKQGSARGARTAGSSCVYYHPDLAADPAICKLEGVEIEAVALMCRLLGYRPFPEIYDLTSMSYGNIPANFVDAVNGKVPLSLMDPDSMVPFVRKRAVNDESSTSDVGALLDDYMAVTPVLQHTDYFSDLPLANRSVSERVASGGLLFLQQMHEISGSASSIIPGTHYMCAGLPNHDVVTRLYGTDWKLAMRELIKKPEMIHGFEKEDRHELIAMLLTEYNKAVAIVNGIEKLVSNTQSLQAIGTRYPSIAHKWTNRVAADLRDNEAVHKSLAGVLGSLRTEMVRYVPIDPDPETDDAVIKLYASMLAEPIKASNERVDSQGYSSYIRGKLEIKALDTDSSETISVKRLGSESSVRVFVTPVRVGTERMQDLTIRALDSLVWTKGDYKDAIIKYLRSAGLSAVSIRKVSLRGSDVDAGALLQELKDTSSLKHRRTSQFKITLPRPVVVDD